MIYVPVFSKGSGNKTIIDYTNAITNLTGTGLYSLIEAFGSKDFGYDTTYSAARSIKKFKEKCISPNNSQFYIDSSGYSFIKGDVARYDASKLIDCYHAYLDHQRDDFDYIFSLDLPISLGSPLYNTKDNVYQFNKRSLAQSKKLLQEDSALANKFLFIYQFRTKEHYEIWDKIYKELELGKILKNWSLGGMVGLKGLTKITFSPFIAMAFRSFHDYLHSTNPNKIFKLHFLGIYQHPERFHIAFLEKLFAAYLAEYAGTSFSYDSINYIRQAQKLKTFEVFNLEGGELSSTISLNTPEEILRHIYFTDDLYTGIKEEIEKRKAGLPIANINSFTPLNVYSNLQIDRFFEYIIDEYSMVDIFMRSTVLQQVDSEFTHIFKTLSKKYPKVITSHFVRAIKLNLQITFEFHRWYKQQGDKKSLDNIIDAFIKQIGIKDTLK
jgi:hypothetical protein